MTRRPSADVYHGVRSIETASTDSSVVELMASSDGTEVMRWSVKKGAWLGVTPHESFTGYEFFYVVDGCLQGEVADKPIPLNSGDIFTAADIVEPVIFRAKRDSLLIYITSQPVFHLLSSQTNDLMLLAVRVEERDEYTAGHCRRIQDLSVRVGKHLNLSSTSIYRLLFGGFLHDVGKCKIPEEIVLKDGPLTDEQWELMKQHPILGKEMVSMTSLRDVGKVIEQHHERLDGSGYPYGLQGDEIMIEAQIIGVVDSYDAMTTDRPYRKGRSREWAIEELRNNAGTLYAEPIVDALEAVLTEMDEN